jgi:F0F1-type ATP synthase epsilon subunit
MKLSIYSLQETLFEGKIEKLIAHTPMGEITVLDGHLPLISTLLGPTVDIFDDKSRKTEVKLNTGVLEVRPESEVVILTNSEL